MFSSRFYSICGSAGKLLITFNVSNIIFDKSVNQFGHETRDRIITRIRVTYIMAIGWAAASLYAAYTFRKRGDLDRFNLTFAYWLVGVLATIGLTFLQIRCTDLVLVINDFFLLMKQIHRKHMPDHNPNKSSYNFLCEVILCAFACFFCGSYLIMWLLLIYDPSGMIFLGSLVPKDYLTLPVRLLIIGYHSYILAVVHIAVCFLSGMILVYGFYLTPLYLCEMKLGRKKYNTDVGLRTMRTIQLMFRSIQILHAYGLYIAGVFVLIAHGFIMYTAMFCSAVLMRYWSDLMPISRTQLCVVISGFLVFWMCVLELGRFFFAKGNKTLGSWKGRKWGSEANNKQMKKFLRSCKPIVISYGTQFVIRRATLIIFLRGVVRGTFRTLMLLGRKK